MSVWRIQVFGDVPFSGITTGLKNCGDQAGFSHDPVDSDRAESFGVEQPSGFGEDFLSACRVHAITITYRSVKHLAFGKTSHIGLWNDKNQAPFEETWFGESCYSQLVLLAFSAENVETRVLVDRCFGDPENTSDDSNRNDGKADG